VFAAPGTNRIALQIHNFRFAAGHGRKTLLHAGPLPFNPTQKGMDPLVFAYRVK
jgi:hypothetical protein